MINLSKRARGFLAVLGGACFHFCIGCVYLWGAMTMYVTSFLYLECEQTNASSQLLMLFLPFRSSLMLFLLPLGAYMERRWGPEPGMLISFIVWLCCFIPLIWVRTTYGYIILMGFGFGIPTGLGYVPALSVAWKHFPHLKGRVSGIILCAYGSGAAILTYVVTFVVNPGDEKVNPDVKDGRDEKLFNEDVYSRIPNMWITLNIIWGLLLLFSVLTVHNPKNWGKDINSEDRGKSELEEHEEVKRAYSVDTISFQDLTEQVRRASTACIKIRENLLKAENKDEITTTEDPLLNTQTTPRTIIMEHECPNVKTGLKSVNFVVMTIMLTMAIFVDFFFSLAYKPMGTHYGYGDVFLSVVGSIYSLFNGLTRVFWGWIFERHTFRVLITIITAGMCLLTGTLPWMGPLSHATFLIWIDTNVLFIAGNYPIYPPTCARLFGSKLGAQIYGFLAAGSFTASAFLCFLANYYLVGKYISYDWFLWTAALVNIPSLFLTWIFVNPAPKWSTKKL